MASIKKYLPYIALLAGILALSFSSLFVRWANAPGPVTAFYRMALASILLLPFYLKQPASDRKSGWKWYYFPLLGGLFTALDHATWSIGITSTRIANATLLNNMAPLWVALIALIFWKEKLTGKFWIGLALTLTGAIIVLGNDLLLHPTLSGGDFISMASSLFYAGYFLVTQRSREKLSTFTYIWMVDVAAAVFLLGINLVWGQPLWGFDNLTYLAFFGSALISQVVGYFSVGYALGHLPASVVSPTMIAQPVLTAILAIPLAGESIMLSQVLGGLAVLGGIYIINTRANQQPKSG
jgi:drug/metabolite transporter (DMT)-like permease